MPVCCVPSLYLVATSFKLRIWSLCLVAIKGVPEEITSCMAVLILLCMVVGMARPSWEQDVWHFWHQSLELFAHFSYSMFFSVLELKKWSNFVNKYVLVKISNIELWNVVRKLVWIFDSYSKFQIFAQPYFILFLLHSFSVNIFDMFISYMYEHVCVCRGRHWNRCVFCVYGCMCKWIRLPSATYDFTHFQGPVLVCACNIPPLIWSFFGPLWLDHLHDSF